MKRVFAFIGFSFAFTLIMLSVIPISAHIIILPILAILLVATLLINETRQAIVLPVVLGSAILACLIFTLSSNNIVAPITDLAGKTTTATIQLDNLPRKTERGYSYIVKAKSINLDDAPQDIKVKLFSAERLDADYCDTLNAELSFYEINTNNYSDGVFIGAVIGDYQVEKSNNTSLKYYVLKARDYIHNTLINELDGDTGALSLALLTGDKSELSYDTYNNFKLCGFLHFVAVSGFHLSCVCFGLYTILKLLGVKKNINIPITLLLSFIYCEIADLSKPVVRAFIMVSLLLISRLFNKKADTLNSLGFALFIVCINPYVIYDAGTIMTFSSVVGIVVIATPVIRKIKFKNQISKYIISALIVSVSVVIALMPAYYIFFGSFSVMTIFINLIFEPFITLLLIAVIMFVLLSKISFVAILPKLIVKLISAVILYATEFLSQKLRFLYIDISSEIFLLFIALVILIIGITLIIKKNISIKATAVLISIALAVSFGLSFYQQYKYTTFMINADGSVIIGDRHSTIVMSLTDKYEYSDANKLLKKNNAVIINSRDYARSENLVNINPSVDGFNNVTLCDDIAVTYDNDIFRVYIYEKVFEITDDYVIINDNKLSRRLNDKYNNAEDTILTFGRDTEIQMRRVGNG